MREELHPLLATLRFHGMAQALDRLLDQAEKDGTPLAQVLLQLLPEELRHRQERSLAYRISQAKLPWDWSIRLLNRLSQYDVLLIDELGYLTLKPEQVNAFFKLLDQRYGKVPTIITTNLVYSDWYKLFQRKSLVDALLDRLQHHCITIQIDGPSLRTPDPTPSSPRRGTKPAEKNVPADRT